MPVCPYCKNEIKSLNAIEKRYFCHRAYIRKGELITTFGRDIVCDSEPQGIVAYKCPYCNHIIATTRQEAINFLLDKKIPEGLVPVEKRGNETILE